MEFTDSQIERYARHIILREVGGAGQQALLRARVLVIGAGGLGSPVLMYLAAAGVGRIGVIDDDLVGLSNLQRQVVHATDRVGTPKVTSAVEAIAAINPEIVVRPHHTRLTSDNAMALFAGYDIVADGSDNFATRFLVNDACYFARIPLVSAAILRFDGQLATFKAYCKGDDQPCYRCIFGGPPADDAGDTCASVGVLGAIAGVMGALQATEVIKELVGIGDTMSGRLMLYDALAASFRTIRVRRDRGCPLCGEHPSITRLDG